MVIKILKQDQQTLLVNITSHPIIDSPEQTEIIQAEQPEEALRIPMSLGPLKEYQNSKKMTQQKIDVILNPSLIPLLKQDKDSLY